VGQGGVASLLAQFNRPLPFDRPLRMIHERQNGVMDHHFVGIPELTGVPRVAVVIDVMRAFTVAAWAFSRGVERIVLASTESEALALEESHSGWLALKDGPPAAGFDAVNSPGLLRSRDFAGRTLVQKTTAGTVGALAVANAPLVLCASLAGGLRSGYHPDDVDLCLENDRFSFAMVARQEESLTVLRPVPSSS
jgi:hypothetical protein